MTTATFDEALAALQNRITAYLAADDAILDTPLGMTLSDYWHHLVEARNRVRGVDLDADRRMVARGMAFMDRVEQLTPYHRD